MGSERSAPICADARSDIGLGRRFDLVIAPQVLVQMFETRADRVAIMEGAARHLARPHGSFWMTFNPDLEQAWADEEAAPLAPQVTEVDGRAFEIEPLEGYWYSHEGERSLRIVWSRRVDGDESTIERSYADLTQGGLEDEAAEVGLELVDSITLPGNNELPRPGGLAVHRGRRGQRCLIDSIGANRKKTASSGFLMRCRRSPATSGATEIHRFERE